MANIKKSNNKENLPIVDSDISENDFVFVENDKNNHEQKFVTKPTTFIKDSFKRFCKNKSSVVAGIILGSLLVLSFLIPLVDQYDVTSSHTELTYLEPKLFPSGTGFWDGTKSFENIATDISGNPDAKTEQEKQESWWPNPARYEKNGVTRKVFSDVTYTSSVSEFGQKGYVLAGYYSTETNDYVSFKTYDMKADIVFNLNVDTYLDTFDVFDIQKIRIEEENEYIEFPENYVQGECALFFEYYNEELQKEGVQLTEYKSVHNIGSTTKGYSDSKINISKIIKEKTGLDEIKKGSFSVRVKNSNNKQNTCVLIKSITFSTLSSDTNLKTILADFSFNDATACLCQAIKSGEGPNYKFWSCGGVKNAYLSQVIYCSFVYDSYEAMLGTKTMSPFPNITLNEYKENGWIDYNIQPVWQDGKYVLNNFYFKILDPEKCPIAKELTEEDVHISPNGEWTTNCEVTYYKYYGYPTMPTFIFGTDKTGRDMLKYVFEGLRTSLLLGLLTFAVCFTFGLIYGAVSGYYGGTVDLVMERFTDILSGVPWIVVMTLVIINLGSNFWTFAIALCLTGWIGTAATTRTQFYRFRGREYVLASRTLGASSPRLIAKHILPNAMGTIITGAVLMIPSIIFSEATISYLGLGLKNMSSLGVILSNNQNELTNNPYLLIFPSIVIALLMICFNLFGNGLRDAINPSLKGEEQ